MEKTQKAVLSLFLLCLSILIIPKASQAQGLALKLFGGYGFIAGGDMRDGEKSQAEALQRNLQILGRPARLDLKSPWAAWDAGVDIVYYFSRNIGFGLGAGSLRSMIGESTLDTVPPARPSPVFSQNPKVSAVPLRASLYLTIPLGTGIRITFHGGASYYLAKIEEKYTITYSGDLGGGENTDTFWEREESHAEGNGLGFHGGIGFEVNLSSHLALIAEGTGRLAKLSGFSGDASVSGFAAYGNYSYAVSGKYYLCRATQLHFFDDGANAYTFFYTIIYSSAPPIAVREATVDFSGFSTRLGLIYKF